MGKDFVSSLGEEDHELGNRRASGEMVLVKISGSGGWVFVGLVIYTRKNSR